MGPPWRLPQRASCYLKLVEGLSMTETAFWKQSAAALLAELGTPDGGLTSREDTDCPRRMADYRRNP